MKRLFRKFIDALIYVGQVFYAVFLTLFGVGLALIAFCVIAKLVLFLLGVIF